MPKKPLASIFTFASITSRDRPKSAPYPRLKNSKKTSKCQVFSFTVLENQKLFEKNFSKKLHTQKKMDRVARRGPLARAPGALKGDTSAIINIFVAVEGGTLRRKNKLSKKISQCRKTEWGTLWDIKHPMCCKISKKLKGDPLERKKSRKKKSHNAEKLKGGTLWGFSTSILPQNIKTLEGEKVLFSKKTQCRKKL